MSWKRFRIEFTAEAIIDIDDMVIDEVDDGWRAVFYDISTPCEIAEHVGYNLIINHLAIERMDGWANEAFRGFSKGYQ